MNIGEFINKIRGPLNIPNFGIISVLEILIISIIIYEIFNSLKKSGAWVLIKGFLFLIVFILFAWIFRMNTILWIIYKFSSVIVIGLLVIFNREIRRFIERLGENNRISNFIKRSGEDNKERFSVEEKEAIVNAVKNLSNSKTGALITIEKEKILKEFIETGIKIKGVISSALLENIFYHNAPLHDGGVIISRGIITAATCYYPVSSNTNLGKHLGTRHRAALGISEISDSLTIVVSEETGNISIAENGRLIENVSLKKLETKLESERLI